MMFNDFDGISTLTGWAKDNRLLDNEVVPQLANLYSFQKGKCLLVNSRMEEAERCFDSIRWQTRGQKQLVMRYLIPCKLARGKVYAPRPEEDDLPEYRELASAISLCRFQEFNEVVEKYEGLWMKRGIYFVVEKLRIIIWRNIIKYLALLKGEKIDMVYIRKAATLAGAFPEGEDEQNYSSMCVVSKLISDGLLKGYIYHSETACALVLSKKGDGIPRLSTVLK